MEEFKKKVLAHVEHIKTVGSHCTTEETTKQALILPLLNILDFNPFDPQKVKAEFGANFPGAKASERVDYALFSSGTPVMFIEAKPYNNKLTNHDGQLSRYFNSTPGVTVAAITNGTEWRFFTDLKLPNVMDSTPFLTVNFEMLEDKDIEQLSKFRYDMFNPDKLKSFAEERNLLDLFTCTIGNCLREVDQDFVRFIATRANLTPKLTTKFLETIAPLVKQSLKDAISEMVVSGLSTPQPVITPTQATAANQPDATEETSESIDIIDPVNPKIITTAAERKILTIIKDMLSGVVNEEEIVGKDTESYYSVLYQNKTNRWIIRYVGDKKKTQVYFPIELTEQHKAGINKCGLEFGSGGSIILDKPESVMRLSVVIFDALAYCLDDNNFKRERGNKGEVLETQDGI
ncbi:MAG TPA: type I restriction endonuclease subunit R [Desulfuromonadales bacterium]|nr:type I restriction endonuclease subunit R [Desulfuromonadales bacterium]